jgi:hypothetical protein
MVGFAHRKERNKRERSGLCPHIKRPYFLLEKRK